MTDLATSLNPESLDAGSGASPAPAQKPLTGAPTTTAQTTTAPRTMAPTTLITEEQVRFSTAAAVALPGAVAVPPAKTRGLGDVVHELAEKVRAVFARSEKRPAKRHYPTRYDFMEDARMRREMDRL